MKKLILLVLPLILVACMHKPENTDIPSPTTTDEIAPKTQETTPSPSEDTKKPTQKPTKTESETKTDTSTDEMTEELDKLIDDIIGG